MVMAVALSFWNLLTGTFSGLVLAASVAGFSCYAWAGLLYGEALTIISSFLQYMFMVCAGRG